MTNQHTQGEMSNQIYHLDPDFRRNPPIRPFTNEDKPYCICCRKPLLDSTKKLTGVPVTVNWETWQVVAGNNNQNLLGADKHITAAFENGMMGNGCWKKTKKSPILEDAT